MRRSWFQSWGWVYRPSSWQGFMVVVLALIFSLQVFIAVDMHSHSISDTLYGIFPYWIPCWMLVYWVATKTSNPEA